MCAHAPHVHAHKQASQGGEGRDLRGRTEEGKDQQAKLSTARPPNPPLAQEMAAAGGRPLFPGRDAPVVAGVFADKLKEHQWDGLRFAWRSLVDE